MYLVDANVWLERLLDQERSEEVGRFLDGIPSEQLFVTDFAFHSVALTLIRLNHADDLSRFVQDIFVDGSVVLVHLRPEDTPRILAAMQQFNLDFDDAYQSIAAELFALTLVSFDADFDRTSRGRKLPREIMVEK
jgi:uncharacterized protein